LIAHVVDVNGVKYHIEFLSKNEHQLKQEIVASVRNDGKAYSPNENKCINIKGNKKHIKRIELSRNYIMFVFTVLFIILCYKTIRKFKNSK